MDDSTAFIAHLISESERFGSSLALANPTDPVPSCPDWTASDLLWHLTEVQVFWSAIVGRRLEDPSEAESTKPARPSDFVEGLSLFERTTGDLVGALESASPSTPVWTWSDDHTVSFVTRRQAHEALIHRIDAELVVGDASELDPDLAADGIDEALRIIFGGVASGQRFSAGGGNGRLSTVSGAASWDIELGRLGGTNPSTGSTYEVDSFVVVDRGLSAEPDFTVEGPAGHLDAWLWGRQTLDGLSATGDSAVLERFVSSLSPG